MKHSFHYQKSVLEWKCHISLGWILTVSTIQIQSRATCNIGYALQPLRFDTGHTFPLYSS